MIDTCRFLSIVCCLTFALSAQCICADEVILDENKYDDVFVGDFYCSPCRYQPNMAFKIGPGKDSITTGELWSYFKGQGINSMDHLVICMDIDPTSDHTDVDVQEFELTIQDPFDRATLTSYSLDRGGDNSLIVPGYEASSFRAEAQMKIDLGFDFMEVYSENSTEQVSLNVQINGESSAHPSFFISTNDSYYSLPSAFSIGLFSLFWIVVFLVLFRTTRPVKLQKSKRAIA